MDYKDFIKPNNLAIFIPYWADYDNICDDEKLVKISEFRPYYSNGMADPTPDEYDETCWVEVYDINDGETMQVQLGWLVPVEKGEGNVIYRGQSCEILYKNEEQDLIVVEDRFGDKVVLSDWQWQPQRDIHDLDNEELTQLFNGCVKGSDFLSDYSNEQGVTNEQAFAFVDGFCEEIGYDDDRCCAELFIEYVRYTE